MGLVNSVLNRVDALNDLNVGFFKREIHSRATNLFITAPAELGEVAKNILLTPVNAASTVLKTLTKATVLLTGSATLKKFDEKLPGFNDLIQSISNVFAYAIGAFLSATVGVLFPNVNYKLQCSLGLAVNPRYQEITLSFDDNEDLTPEEQELLYNLNLAFEMAMQLEAEANEALHAATLELKKF